jgi:NAD(P)-dependent dehydrogenase (short-subunit alcohol dehydrogenase family)
MIFRLQKQITKMQKEMNSLFKNAQKELNKESKGQERALKQTMIQLAELKKVFDVNIFGVFELTKTVLPFMNSNGHIVMNSTMGAVQGSVKYAGLSAYSSSKAALINLTEVLAEEFKEKGPAVNCLAFGAGQTEMFEEAFPGGEAPVSAEEMADYVIDFALKGNRLYNGKLLQISNSTP